MEVHDIGDRGADALRAVERVRGDETGLLIPAHQQALLEGGASFLTDAFRAFGSISADNRVTAIRKVDPCPGGSTGKKVFLELEYLRQESGLHADLFVKFSRDFDDPVRDERGRYEMEGEVKLAALSHLPEFPVTVPRAYFADYEAHSHTGLIITERVGFGSGAIEPHKEKCLDHELADPLPYYRTILTSLARISAMSRSPAHSAMFERSFPFDPVEAAGAIAIQGDADGLLARIDSFAEFVSRHRHLYPEGIDASLFADMRRLAPVVHAHQRKLAAFLQSDPEMIAFCHWNANIDNAWFWRDGSGRLQCGLMDWGHAGRMNVAYSLWGCLSGAHFGVWRRHLDEMIDVFVETLNAQADVALDHARVARHFRIYVALMGLSYFIDAPARIRSRFPGFADATDRYDPVFKRYPAARNQLHISLAFLELWRQGGIEAEIEQVVSA